MGVSSSTANNYVDGSSFDSSRQDEKVLSSEDYLKALAGIVHKEQNYYGEKTGGGGNVIGGYSSLEEYGNSMFSAAKGDLIRSIAKDVAGVLKISSSFAETADLKDLIEKFEKIVPNPRQGRKIKVDKKIHVDVCKKFAAAINKTYKMNLINLDDTAEQMCQAVSELLYSLFTGLHSEFITVSGDITRIMRNLNALQDYVDGVHSKLIKDLEEASPGEASLIKDAYEALSREIRRQHAYLANLSSGVIGPVGSSLINLLEENKAMPGLTDDLRAITGSREFSDKLSSMMSGTSNVAHAAYLVDKALKQLGMSVPEYKNTKNMKGLRNLIYEKLVKSKPNSKQMNKLLIAADILYRNDLSHENIADYLSKSGKSGKSGGDSTNFAQLVSDSLYRDPTSVFKGRRHADKQSIGRSLNKRTVYREKLFSALNQQIQDCYNHIISELYKIGKKIGSDIPITDTLRSFVRQLGYFSGVQPDRKDLHIALSGYRRDVNSEYVKHDFLKSLDTLKDAADSVASGSTYFKNVSSAIHRLIKIIDDFNSTFTKTLTEVHVENDRKYESTGGVPYDTTGGSSVGDYLDKLHGSEVRGGADSDSDDGDFDGVDGDFDGDVSGGDDADFKYLVTMKKAIREIEYYYKIANIKANLKIASMQHESYTKDYENILGEECGMIIDLINAKYKALTCEDDTLLGSKIGKTRPGAPPAIVNNNQMCQVKNITYDPVFNPMVTAGGSNAAEYWGAYTFMLEYIRSAKVEMIEAAQALDLYLSKFTAQIQSNPDDIKDFVKLLEQIEIVSKWFTDKSGDNLTHVFESFGEGGGVPRQPLTTTTPTYSVHYYATLTNTAANQAIIPGDWTDGILLDNKDKAKEFVIRMEKSIKSMRALENIIAVFSKLSNKSSGDEIHTFMSPGLIFKAFMKYTVATSIAMGSDVWAPPNDYRTWINVTGPPRRTPNQINTVHLRPINSKWLVRYYFDPLALDSGYMTTDLIFEMSIKSMISKVFTIVGSYSLFQRPAKDFNNNKALANTPLRQIMGGGATVKIIPDAVELYIRLTLLGEWYRELFEYKKQTPAVTTATPIIVSMIPSFDGIWADFVKVVFVDAANINDGGYTDSFTQELISSINDIYTHYKPKYGADVCTKILENFVAEVNLRYGLIMQDEINNYIAEKNKGLNDETYATDDNVDYDILDAKDQFSRNSAPSDKFIKESYKSSRLSTLANKHFNNQIKAFRMKVEANLDLSANRPNIGKYSSNTGTLGNNFGILGLKYSSVDDLVNQTVKRIKETDSDDKKYKIVQNTILGVERYSDVDYDCMLMFHETVINPLTIIYTVYKMINHFNRFANSLHFNVDPSKPGNFLNDIRQGFTALTGLPGDDKYRKLEAGDRERPYLYFNNADYFRYGGFALLGPANINFNTLVEDTINHLIYLTCDKNPMVELYFSGDGTNRYPMLSFKNLEKYVIELLENVGESLNKLRKFIPHDIVARYEDNLQKDFTMTNAVPENPNVISLFYLKEHFVDRLIKNKYGGGLSDANIALKSIWTMATAQNAAGNAARFPGQGPYNNLIAKLVYWDSTFTPANTMLYNFPARTIRSLVGTGSNDNWTKFPINKTGITKQSYIVDARVPKAVMDTLLSSTFSATPINGSPGEIYRDASGIFTDEYRGSFGFTGIYDYDNINQIYGIKYNTNLFNRLSYNGREGAYGLVFKLNRLIYHYVNLFTDRTSNKIYLPLLEKFANGINAREIMKGEAIDDITRMNDVGPQNNLNVALFPIREIDSKSVIFATLARSIRNIVTDKKAGIAAVSILMNAESNLLNVSEYMKDIMTAYLPIFEKQLNIMCNQAELIKSLIENTKLKVAGTAPGADDPNNYNNVAASQVKTDGVALTLKIRKVAISEADSKGHFLTLLSSIIATSKSLQSCVKNVYKELADIPLYFETYQNSITDYKNRNGVLPLMPLSQVSHLLNNQHRLVPGFDMTLQLKINTMKFGGVSNTLLQNAVNELRAALTANAAQAPAIAAALVATNTAVADTTAAFNATGIANTAAAAAVADTAAALAATNAAAILILPNAAAVAQAALDTNNAIAATNAAGVLTNQAALDTNTAIAATNAAAVLTAAAYLPIRNANTNTITSITRIINDNLTSPDKLGPDVIKGMRDEIIYTPAPNVRNPAVIADLLTDDEINKWIGILTNLAKSVPPPVVPILQPDVGKRYKYYSCRGLIPHQDVGVGSDEFKFAYGTRGLLADDNEPNVEMAPGVIGVLDIYNSKVGGAASYDKRKMVDSFVNSTHLLRFATDYIYHKTYLCNNDLDKLTEFYLVGTATAVITPETVPVGNLLNLNMLQHLSCQTGRHSFNRINVRTNGLIAANNEFFRITSNITLLTENDNYKQSVYRMLRCIIDSNLSEHMHEQNRTQLRIYNILDSNIVPINFHALQREIALINIYNYSYTFDHMIKQFIGVETVSRTIDQIKLSDVPINIGNGDGSVIEVVDTTVLNANRVQKIGIYPEDTLVRILIQPQGKRYLKEYVNNIWKLMAGNDSISLNKPKYLSDQLWNKVLLNSLYKNTIIQPPNIANQGMQFIDMGVSGSNLARTMQLGHTRKANPQYNEPIDGAANGVLLNHGFEEITYVSNVGNTNKHSLTIVDVPLPNIATKRDWHNNGYARYQTILVRYIEWFVHLQRVMRLLMRDQLTWVNDPIVHKSNALSNEVTEYESNNKFKMSDFE